MDGDQFDAIARAVGTRDSRRRMLGRSVGGMLAGLSGAFAAEAKNKRKHKKAKPKPKAKSKDRKQRATDVGQVETAVAPKDCADRCREVCGLKELPVVVENSDCMRECLRTCRSCQFDNKEAVCCANNRAGPLCQDFVCADLKTDKNNCGSCGVRCEGPCCDGVCCLGCEICNAAGKCEPDCPDCQTCKNGGAFFPDACEAVDCGDPCLTCVNNACRPKCGECQKCVNGECKEIDCGSPCLECFRSSCRPKDCGPCADCEEDPIRGSICVSRCLTCQTCDGGTCVDDCGSCQVCRRADLGVARGNGTKEAPLTDAGECKAKCTDPCTECVGGGCVPKQCPDTAPDCVDGQCTCASRLTCSYGCCPKDNVIARYPDGSVQTCCCAGVCGTGPNNTVGPDGIKFCCCSEGPTCYCPASGFTGCCDRTQLAAGYVCRNDLCASTGQRPICGPPASSG
jgi:hypothetical protein